MTNIKCLTSLTLCILILQRILGVSTLNNGLAASPPMGWSARLRFACETDCESSPKDCINGQLVKEVADKLRLDGYRELGYNLLLLDDCWTSKKRDPATGSLLTDPERFPGGLNVLSQHLHNINFKLGASETCGYLTQNGYPGLLRASSSDDKIGDNLEQDAKTLLNDWDLDSISLDGWMPDAPRRINQICSSLVTNTFQSARPERPTLVRCNWPHRVASAHSERGDLDLDLVNITQVAESCNTWRLFAETEDSWMSILSTVDEVVKYQAKLVEYHGPGQWFDPGELVIGNNGLSYEQARAQMALWSMWSAPLFMSNDLRLLTSMENNGADQLIHILKNYHLIELDQDPLAILGLKVAESADGFEQAFVKPVYELSPNGCPSFAILYLNRATLGNRRLISFSLRDLLTKVPLKLAEERYAGIIRRIGSQQVTNTHVIDAKSCSRLLHKAMSSPPVPIPTDLLITEARQQQIKVSEPLTQVQVNYEVQDLLSGRVLQRPLGLDSNLTLLVNPSGVALVRLREI